MVSLNEKQQELVQEAHWVHASFIIEVQGNDREHVNKALDELIERLEKEKDVSLIESQKDELVDLKEGWYSVTVELTFIAKEFTRLVQLALLYSPSAVEIYTPKKIEMNVGDAQNILVDISEVLTSLAHTIFAQQGAMRRAGIELKPPQDPSKST